jgi:hypothetical protein
MPQGQIFTSHINTTNSHHIVISRVISQSTTNHNSRSYKSKHIKQRRHHLVGCSGRYYHSVCCGARSVVIDRMAEYEKPELIEEH